MVNGAPSPTQEYPKAFQHISFLLIYWTSSHSHDQFLCMSTAAGATLHARPVHVRLRLMCVLGAARRALLRMPGGGTSANGSQVPKFQSFKAPKFQSSQVPKFPSFQVSNFKSSKAPKFPSF